MSEKYPGIEKAALEIAYDNGGINRTRSREQMLDELRRWLSREPQEPLPEIDAWLANLSQADLELVCCGEHADANILLQNAPPHTDNLLNRYFEEVC